MKAKQLISKLKEQAQYLVNGLKPSKIQKELLFLPKKVKEIWKLKNNKLKTAAVTAAAAVVVVVNFKILDQVLN